MILILDLDDTIFETRSMDMSVFDPAKQVVEEFTLKNFSKKISSNIIEEVKNTPFDIVANKYQFPVHVREKFYDIIQNIDYSLSIRTFEDYTALKKLDYEMYLVTTGMTNLQNAKIAALDISSDFKGIFIDDPFDPKRKQKLGLFKEIANSKESNQFWVIGDNPNSELKAGKDLGMKTIQRISQNQEVSTFSDYSIETFYELENIIKSATYNTT